MKIGVLALQGAVAEHVRLLQQAGADAVAVKRPHELEDLDGLVIPGGESTTISKLMHKYDLFVPILEMYKQQKPLFGTCAGLILLAARIEGHEQAHLGLLNISVERNAFGRQRESFEMDLEVTGIAEEFPAVFIRAPIITGIDDTVTPLSQVGDRIVAVREGFVLGASFHPELTDDNRIHTYFLKMVKEAMTIRMSSSLT
ncbi:pyridoxal 5'-phosphate synthase glutaminase subunit PdxT [Mechercharimyces sp. CAU 1602]|uniref:pyridoxal 5'-phosphate synthase glutaminase subunit PdxT n=1 Tax=Mechercharimyces sp. CAU 1602 TaxID=2973933 RepID=UPI002162A472|nr:pyridoxal 5'-phosphate synthase glutaminase subunit PdxT [Mechercharimyces sp. CAU 1602]MCS1352708.1 pyridoxal 5'-phosphate synthase glutaminase subunit PdxT [Mechercharimyces sp. CAU 1602]